MGGHWLNIKEEECIKEENIAGFWEGLDRSASSLAESVASIRALYQSV